MVRRVEGAARGIMAAALVGSLVSACGWAKEVQGSAETALPCGAGEIYPTEEDVPPPEEASYIIEAPQEQGCAVQVFLDDYQDVYLTIMADRVELIVFDDALGGYGVNSTWPIPEGEEVIEFSFKGMKGQIQLTEAGNYLVKHWREQPDEMGPVWTPEPLIGLVCEDKHLYPDEVGLIPTEGKYVIIPPERDQECAIQLVAHERMFAYLEIKSKVVDLFVLVPDLGPYSPWGSVPPAGEVVLENIYRGLWFRVSLTENGNYLVEYTFDESEVPPLSTPVPNGVE